VSERHKYVIIDQVLSHLGDHYCSVV